MYLRQFRWARRSHSTKPSGWRRSRYWGRFTQRRDQWVFGDKHTGNFLWKYSWFPIERHVLVRGRSSKDDPDLADYWAARDRAKAKSLKPRDRTVARAQNGLCDVCGESLLNGEELNRIRPQWKSRDSGVPAADQVLRHLSCQEIHRMRMDRVVRDLLEPDAVKVARPVLRGGAWAVTPCSYPAKHAAHPRAYASSCTITGVAAARPAFTTFIKHPQSNFLNRGSQVRVLPLLPVLRQNVSSGQRKGARNGANFASNQVRAPCHPQLPEWSSRLADRTCESS